MGRGLQHSQHSALPPTREKLPTPSGMKTGFPRVRVSTHNIIWTQVCGPTVQGFFHWTILALDKQVLFWGTFAYHRFVLVLFMQSFKFLLSCPKSHLLCDRCICVPVYKYSTVSKKIGEKGRERNYDPKTLKLQMLGMCSVSWGQRSKKEAPVGMQNLGLYHRISYPLFSLSFSVCPKFRCLVSQRTTWGKSVWYQV